ncbi:GNAT family N-acetyltransferase [Chenggangzhangella methanolivorans]|uniref:GNAT family N-acetyltransferase n=1 Tax=Chenggangzhangella methanolivorans TaxID=1437009 RepID=A0A9E6UP04_9HYPH|nr:GNAT family N-acetyltransferase [Chenggangzhangella methanolivorans]QZN99194.1 GNAT family N-acetyltransferase [Chenggangzhangella methanolivorans]
MTPEFLIREATDDDGEALAALLAREWAAYGATLSQAENKMLAQPASAFADAGGRLWLVTRDGDVAGSLGVAPAARPGEFELRLLCLETSARGQGLAAALVVGADAFAAASGAARLDAWVDERLADGVACLERQGFVRDPGVRRRGDDERALDAHYSREVASEISSQPSEDRPAAGG